MFATHSYFSPPSHIFSNMQADSQSSEPKNQDKG